MKIRKVLLLVTIILLISMVFVACDDDNSPANTADEYFKNVNMPLVYEIYLDYMDEIGEQPLSYEEWFDVVHGDEFQQGIIPEIRKNELTDFWEISYNNGKGWNDLRFKTETEEQKNCNHNFGKWITLCEGNDYFNGIRYRSCKRCNYKDYQFKLNGNVCLHNESDWIIDKEATTTLEGKKHIECTLCGVVLREESIPKVEEPTNDSTGLEFTLNDDGNSYSVTGIGTYSDIKLIIPSTHNNKPVTGIGVNAFWGCNHLTSVFIPDSITNIDEGAFSDCSNIKSVHITDISAWLKIDFNEFVSNPCYYEAALYLNNERVTELIIPDGVTNIEDFACYGCGSITSVIIPDSVICVGEYSFGACHSLNSVTVLGSVPNFEACAFYDSYATRVYITDIQSWITTDFNDITANPCNGGAILYVNNKKLTILDIPDGVEKIGNYTFSGCIELANIIISGSVKNIGRGAFYNCSSLSYIALPNSVESIGDFAFGECTGLKYIELPNSVTNIGEGAFTFSGLESVIIPNSVTSIGDSAFSDCRSLMSINIPTRITKIGTAVFLGCSSLTNVIIPNNIKSIDDYAFSHCYSLTSILIPDSVTSIGSQVFFNCHSLKSIFIPGSVTCIGSSAFRNCYNLTYVTIENGVMNIGDNAFNECKSLMNITIPDSVVSIGTAAFMECNSIKYNEYNNAYYIGNSFNPYLILIKAKNQSITSCEINDNTKFIYSHAFSNCKNLTSIVIPDSVTSIGDYAFSGCSSLTSITFEGTKAQWNAIWKNTNIGNYTIHCTDGDIEKSNS